MPITGDLDAVSIVTYKAVPLSMGDCVVKVVPTPTHTRYEVQGQFVGYDSASPIVVSGALRGEAEDYLADVVTACGGLAQTQEIQGPKGRRLIVGDYTPGDLVSPYATKTYSGLSLTEVSSDDTGGKFYTVNYVFVKPLTVADDGTTASTVLFDATQIGNRGGYATINADGESLTITATSQYVGASPLNYFQTLLNTLGVERFYTVPNPRGVSGNRLSINSYNSIIGTFEWVGKGTISGAAIQSMSFTEESTGIFNISTTLIARR